MLKSRNIVVVAKKIKQDLKLLGGKIIETKINNKKGMIING